VLTARGSTFEEPKRTQMASVATRAALETERGLAQPRFQEYSSGGRIFIALAPELKNYAVALGRLADSLAKADPLPSPGSVLDSLHAVPVPAFPEGVSAPTDLRLCQLAVAASENAALSSRMEIYPIGMSPVKALALTQNALFGGTLTIEEIRNRVAARLPQAAPMPGRPDLDDLLKEVGLDLKWQPDAADGCGAYQTPGAEGLSLHSSVIFVSVHTACELTEFGERPTAFFPRAPRFLATLSISRQILAILIRTHLNITLRKHPIRIFWRSSLWN
jgi:hypothetical protein